MSTTLKLADRLLARGRRFQELGRDYEALGLLRRLAGFRELPIAVAEEAQARLADIQLRRHKLGAARRHLTAALAHRPDNPRYHHLMAMALEQDARGDLERAAKHYRQSLHNELCLCVPAILVFEFVSAVTTVQYVRYVFLVIPFVIVWASRVGRACEQRQRRRGRRVRRRRPGDDRTAWTRKKLRVDETRRLGSSSAPRDRTRSARAAHFRDETPKLQVRRIA